MLDIQPSIRHNDKDLDALAEFMAIKRDTLKPEILSKTAAGYTYLGQFIVHDISLDSQSQTLPWESPIAPSVNLRNPSFDLETLYGINAGNTSAFLNQNSAELKLGETSSDIASAIRDTFFQDLPRDENGMAMTLDGRNDENLLVAQTHVAFIKFHNAIVSETTGTDVSDVYKKARRRAIRHYQYIILNDFLPKIVKKSVLADVIDNVNQFYKPVADDLFIPLEFSVAAFRMGHSMVRNSYHLNSRQSPRLSSLHIFTGRGGFTGQTNKLPSDWLIDWNSFYNLTGWQNPPDWRNPPDNFNFASKINTEISSGLGKAHIFEPPSVDFKRGNSIPALDLYRTRFFNLPSGQMLAKEIVGEERQIGDSQKIANLLPEDFNGVQLKNVFKDNIPLWFYLLGEAQINEDGENLGEVGSRIVAETFVELLRKSEFSILDEPLLPNSEEFLGKPDGTFEMAEMLNYINSKDSGFLNRVGA